MNKQYDLVIEGGNVLQFEPDTLNCKINIGVKDGKIESITKKAITGQHVIPAKNKIIAPGFIDFHSHVDGKLFSAQCVALQGITSTIGGERNFDGSMIRQIAHNGFLINHGFHISHSFTLRRAVGMKNPYTGATKSEVQDMVNLAEKFFEAGSFGIYFGLEFVPGTTKAEIISLSRVAKQYNKIVLIHLRKDGHEAMNGLNEIIQIAEETGAHIHILHLMYMAGIKGIMGRVIAEIKRARGRGLDITADTGLYSGFPTCIGSPILDHDWRFNYKTEIVKERILISSGIYAGQFCDEEKFQYLRKEFPNTLVTVFGFEESEIVTALKEPFVFVSTNAADGPHYENIGHPETAGTCPRLIAECVRNQEILTLQEAVKKITYLPAQRFGISNRGNVREGYHADLVIFDYETITDKAWYVGPGKDPNAPPRGINWVIVNGEVIAAEGNILEKNNPGVLLSG